MKTVKSILKTVLGLIVLLVLVIVIFGPGESEEERVARTAKEAQEQAARTARETEERAARAAKEADDRRKGFHCLSSWDGSHRALKAYVKKNAREPDSFEYIETRVAPVSKTGTHRLRMKFRARNGFGGMSVGSVLAEIENDGCAFTILETVSQ